MQDARLAAAPEEEKAAIREDIARAEANFTPVPVELPAEDGKVFDFCGGVEIVATPGHLPGHIAVYIRELKTIVMGDAMNTNGVSLQPANPAYTVDMAEAAKSTEKLLKYDIDQVICYHGGVFAGPVKAALAALVEGYKGM
jgi:glyoxylase-like metal-dependent hydrolase (beta-lactamase superfamily II)